MRVLFVSGIDGFCHRYQVLHRAAQMAALGGSSTIRHFADPRLRAEAAAHDVLFLYRVPDTAWVATVAAAARAAGTAVVGAIDDLVFLDDALFPGLERLPEAERELWLDGVRRYRAALARCDAVVVPTEALCEEARAAGLPAVVHRNSVSDGEVALAAAAREAAAERSAGRPPHGGGAAAEVVLGYFSGTPTHDRDLAAVTPALAQLLRRRSGVRLRLVGPVEPGPELAALGDRVERRPAVPWWQLAAQVAACDVSLAPLDLTTRFAACKGEIKFLEAGAVGVPLVASPSPAFRHAIRDGESGRLAASVGEWQAALQELVDDPALRRRLGAAARADVLARWSCAARAPELGAILGRAVREAGVRGAPRAGAAPSACRPDREPRQARFALEADGFPGATAAAEPAVESPPLVAGQVLVQRIRPSCDGVERIDVHTVTYGLPVPGRLVLELAEPATAGRDEAQPGRLLARASLEGHEAPDRGWVALESGAPLRAAGRDLVLTVRLVADDPRAAICLGLAGPGATAEAARLDGEPLAGGLALRGFADWGLALAPRATGARGGTGAGAIAAGLESPR